MSAAAVLIGGGGHARVVAEAARLQGLALAGFVDPEPCEATVRLLGLRRLGDDAVLGTMKGVVAVLGVGSVGVSTTRRAIVERLAGTVGGWATVVHPAAYVSAAARVGEGAVVLAGAVVNAGARIGKHCIVNSGAVVEHDVELGDFALVASGAAVGGGTVIGADAFIGLGASLRDHIRIGAGASVGMGAVVIADVAEGARVRAPAAVLQPARHA